MLKFNCQNLKNENPMFAKRFILGGDGESTKLSVNLQASPVAMEFRLGSMPSYAFLRQATGPEIYLSLVAGHLTFQFERPPANGERVDVEVEFFYEGVAL